MDKNDKKNQANGTRLLCYGFDPIGLRHVSCGTSATADTKAVAQAHSLATIVRYLQVHGLKPIDHS